MKNLKLIIILLLSSGICNATYSMSNETSKLIYEAYLSASKTLWVRGVQTAQNDFEQNSSQEELFNFSLAQYGLLNATMKDKDEELFYRYVDGTIENLEKLINQEYRVADSKAILSAIYGLKIAYSPWKGMYLGAQSNGHIQEAMELDPNSPLVWKLYANYKFFTPEMFGGDKLEAISAFEKSMILFERENNLEWNWPYLDLFPFLGIAYQQQERNDEAIAIYMKALEVEPDFSWISNVLLPELNNQ